MVIITLRFVTGERNLELFENFGWLERFDLRERFKVLKFRSNELAQIWAIRDQFERESDWLKSLGT